MVHVVATIRLRPGTRDAYLAAFRPFVPVVRAEAGCVEYTPTGYPNSTDAPDRADVVVVIEKWADMPAFEAHCTAPHMAEYRALVKDYVAEVTLQLLQPLA